MVVERTQTGGHIMTEPQGAVAVEDTPTSATSPTEVQNVEGTTDSPTENLADRPADAQAAAAEATKTEGPTEAEITAAVDGFKALIEQVLVADGRDTASGHLTEELKSQVRTAYVNLPAGASKSSARPQVKDYVEAKLGEGIDTMDVTLARTMFIIKTDCLTARGTGGGPTVARQALDPTVAHIQEIVALYLAPYLKATPEGLDEDWAARANTRAEELHGQLADYATWLHGDPETRGDEPDVADEVKAAGRIAQGRQSRARKAAATDGSTSSTSTGTRGSYTGPKRNIGNHVNQFFDTKPVGYVALIGEIAKFQSAEYGEDRPSSGAVNARVWPNSGGPSTLAGIQQATKDGKKAAVRVPTTPSTTQPAQPTA
jgi:hypothetical protein